MLALLTAPPHEPLPSDPRSVSNLYGYNPAQLAAHRNQRQLSRLLMPSLPLSRVLEALQPDSPRCAVGRARCQRAMHCLTNHASPHA